jgi:hypothetical protein
MTTRPTGRPPAGALVDHRVGQCKLCHRGIYDHEATVWLSNPLGVSHRDCVTQRDGQGRTGGNPS